MMDLALEGSVEVYSYWSSKISGISNDPFPLYFIEILYRP